MDFLCSSPFTNYGDMLHFLRKLDQKDIVAVIPIQTGFIFKKTTFTVLHYRHDA